MHITIPELRGALLLPLLHWSAGGQPPSKGSVRPRHGSGIRIREGQLHVPALSVVHILGMVIAGSFSWPTTTDSRGVFPSRRSVGVTLQ